MQLSDAYYTNSMTSSNSTITVVINYYKSFRLEMCTVLTNSGSQGIKDKYN